MEFLEHYIDISSRATRVRLIPFGDLHEGTRQCDEERLKAEIKNVLETPDTYAFCIGDAMELINLHDKRFDFYSLAPWILDEIKDPPMTRRDQQDAGATVAQIQLTHTVELFRPLANAKKLLFWGVGNHEEQIRLRFENNIGYSIATLLRIPYGGYDAWHDFHFVRAGKTAISFKMYSLHGFTTGRLAGGIHLYLQRLLKDKSDARAIVCGHAHQRHTESVETVSPTFGDNAHVHKIRRYAVMTGGFKNVESRPGYPPTWEEVKGFVGNGLGPVEIWYEPDEDDMHVFF